MAKRRGLTLEQLRQQGLAASRGLRTGRPEEEQMLLEGGEAPPFSGGFTPEAGETPPFLQEEKAAPEAPIRGLTPKSAQRMSEIEFGQLPTADQAGRKVFDMDAIAGSPKLAAIFRKYIPEGGQAITKYKTAKAQAMAEHAARRAEIESLPTKEVDGKTFFDLERIASDANLSNVFSKHVEGGKEMVDKLRDLNRLPTKDIEGQQVYDLEKITADSNLSGIFARRVEGGDKVIDRFASYDKAKRALDPYKSGEGYDVERAARSGVSADHIKLLFDLDDSAIANLRSAAETAPAAPAETGEAAPAPVAATSPEVLAGLQIKSAAAPQGLSEDQARTLAQNTRDTLLGWGYTPEQADAIKSFTREEVKGIDDAKDALDRQAYDTTLEALKIIKPDATMADISPNADRSRTFDLSFFAWGKENPETMAKYDSLPPEEKEKFRQLWQQSLYLFNAAHNVDALLVEARQGNTKESDKALAADLTKNTPVLAKYITGEGLGSGNYSFDIKSAVMGGVDFETLTKAGFEITEKQIADIKEQAVTEREYKTALDQMAPFKTDGGGYDVQAALKLGLSVNTLSMVFDPEDIQQANAANKAEAAMTAYKQKDGSYNLVAAAVDGVSFETMKDAGFKDEVIAEARLEAKNNPLWTPKSDRTPTWNEYKAYFGGQKTDTGTYPSWWNPVQAVKDIASNIEKAKNVDQLYDDYLEKYGYGNFIKSSYQSFLEDNLPAAAALRDDVTLSDISGKEWGQTALNVWLFAGAPGAGAVLKGVGKGIELLPAGKETMTVLKEAVVDGVELAKQAASTTSGAIKGTVVGAKDIAQGVVTGLKGSVTYTKPLYYEVPAAVGKDAELRFIKSLTMDKKVRLGDAFKAGLQEAKTDFARIVKAAELPTVLANRAYIASLKVRFLSKLDETASQFSLIDSKVNPYEKFGIDLRGLTGTGTRAALQTAIAESRYYDELFAEMLSNLKSVSKADLQKLERWSGFKGITRSVDDIGKARAEVDKLAKALDDWPFMSDGYRKALNEYTLAADKLDTAYGVYSDVLTPRINRPVSGKVVKDIEATEAKVRSSLADIGKAKADLARLQAKADPFGQAGPFQPVSTEYLDALERISKLRTNLRAAYDELSKVNARTIQRDFTTNISKKPEGGWPEAIASEERELAMAQNQLSRARASGDDDWIDDALQELRFREGKLEELVAKRQKGEMPPRPDRSAAKAEPSDIGGLFGKPGEPIRPQPKAPPETRIVVERSIDPKTGKTIERQKMVTEPRRKLTTKTMAKEKPQPKAAPKEEVPLPRRAPTVREARPLPGRVPKPGSLEARDESLYGERAYQDRDVEPVRVDAIGKPLAAITGIAAAAKAGTVTAAQAREAAGVSPAVKDTTGPITGISQGPATEPYIAPAPATKTVVSVGTKTMTATKTDTKPKTEKPKFPKAPLNLGMLGEKRSPDDFRGALTWRQGFGFWAAKEPYSKPEDFQFFNEPPAGAVITKDMKSAYETIQQITGQPPERKLLDMGIMDVVVSSPQGQPGVAGAIDFKLDAAQTTQQEVNLRKRAPMAESRLRRGPEHTSDISLRRNPHDTKAAHAGTALDLERKSKGLAPTVPEHKLRARATVRPEGRNLERNTKPLVRVVITPHTSKEVEGRHKGTGIGMAIVKGNPNSGLGKFKGNKSRRVPANTSPQDLNLSRVGKIYVATDSSGNKQLSRRPFKRSTKSKGRRR